MNHTQSHWLLRGSSKHVVYSSSISDLLQHMCCHMMLHQHPAVFSYYSDKRALSGIVKVAQCKWIQNLGVDYTIKWEVVVGGYHYQSPVRETSYQLVISKGTANQ